MAPCMFPMASADMEMLLKLLPDIEDIPDHARATLAAGLPHALAQRPAERHAFQSQFTSTAREALVGALSAAGERQRRSRGEAEAAVAAQAECGKLREQAARAVEAARKVTEDKNAALEAHRSTMAELEQEHMEAEVAKSRVVEARDKTRAEQAELAAVAEDLRGLTDGSCQEDARDVAAEAVQTYVKGRGTEPTLVAAAPAALKRAPAERGPFEKLAVDSVAEILAAAAAELDAKLAGGQAEEDDVKAEALGLWALHDQERERELDARAALGEAKVALDVATAAEKQAASAEAEKGAEVSKRLVEQTLAEEQSGQLRRALEALDRLISSAYEEPKAPEAAAAAAKAAEHAPATGNPFNVPTPMVA